MSQKAVYMYLKTTHYSLLANFYSSYVISDKDGMVFSDLSLQQPDIATDSYHAGKSSLTVERWRHIMQTQSPEGLADLISIHSSQLFSNLAHT